MQPDRAEISALSHRDEGSSNTSRRRRIGPTASYSCAGFVTRTGEPSDVDGCRTALILDP